MGLPDKIVELHRALDAADVPHAFGGALALAWCTQRARGTIDLDVNLFVPPARAEEVVAALPDGVAHDDADLARIRTEGQVRLWWESTPVDLFFNTTDFHERVAERIRDEPFLGVDVPFLSCRDLAVFKAFFDRTKDWADLEEMAAARTLDVEAVLGVLVAHLGGSDPRVERLRALRG
ncbi:hypothetical protein [Actinomarinicola tropica]|uniref:Nucleotidyl transferase AbiEii/AbiGii toxin family protein n=1 Tax=Actinomarinicola tropica TaxID=2789776 RepID=A0A5Q2RKV3_9ACTN|nr:hypothetical protein [Actinomarinicola tropica]QGG94490.1 hypothetical protein GH723_04885 [Actinomarinicola tropica]